MATVTHFTATEFWARKGLSSPEKEQSPVSTFLYFHDSLMLEAYLEQPHVIRRCRELDKSSTITIEDVRAVRKQHQKIANDWHFNYWDKDQAAAYVKAELDHLNELDEQRLVRQLQAAE